MENNLKTYTDELRYNLTLRNLDADTIRDIVREVESEVVSYEEAVSNFGSSDEYAKSFPSTPSPMNHSAFVASGVLLAILWAALTIILRDRDAGPFSGWAITWLPVLGFVAAGIVIDFSRSVARSRASR